MLVRNSGSNTGRGRLDGDPPDTIEVGRQLPGRDMSRQIREEFGDAHLIPFCNFVVGEGATITT
jgi:hypothetical protein